MTLFDDVHASDRAWSVGALTTYIRELFELDFRLQEVSVAGEISNLTHARSGHLYFTLKDEHAQLRCVMWRSTAERLRRIPQDGDAVVATGRISVYESGGVYQLYAENLVPAGRGNLAVAFEELKRRLELEGLFDQERKKPLPGFPRRVGIVTSADGAALHDILNVMKRRCPVTSVLIAPTLVQGPEAPAQVVRSLEWLDGRDDIDVIILARGGGSLEDLWAFNDEGVARAIYEARHPIVSGVGHETDFTIADLVADVRAPTPSAAAELVVPNLAEITPRIESLMTTLANRFIAFLAERNWQLRATVQSLRLASPHFRLISSLQRADFLEGRLDARMGQTLQSAERHLGVLEARLATVSPLATLARGYAIVRDERGIIVRKAAEVQGGDRLRVQFTDGEIGVVVHEE